MELWAKAVVLGSVCAFIRSAVRASEPAGRTCGRTRTAVPPKGRPVPSTEVTGALRTGLGATSVPVHGRTTALPRPRRSAGDLLQVFVVIGAPSFLVLDPGRA